MKNMTIDYKDLKRGDKIKLSNINGRLYPFVDEISVSDVFSIYIVEAEFDKDGNITGILMGTDVENLTIGSPLLEHKNNRWFKNEHEIIEKANMLAIKQTEKQGQSEVYYVLR